MTFEFAKYIDKDGFMLMITPALAFSKESGTKTIAFAWLCFTLTIEF